MQTVFSRIRTALKQQLLADRQMGIQAVPMKPLPAARASTGRRAATSQADAAEKAEQLEEI